MEFRGGKKSHKRCYSNDGGEEIPDVSKTKRQDGALYTVFDVYFRIFTLSLVFKLPPSFFLGSLFIHHLLFA